MGRGKLCRTSCWISACRANRSAHPGRRRRTTLVSPSRNTPTPAIHGAARATRTTPPTWARAMPMSG